MAEKSIKPKAQSTMTMAKAAEPATRVSKGVSKKGVSKKGVSKKGVSKKGVAKRGITNR